jgi:predicted MFS family arabinose efflux permease
MANRIQTNDRRVPQIHPAETWRDRLLPYLLVYIAMAISVVSCLGAPLVPSIAISYHVAVGSAQWSLTAALLVGALSAPVIGRLGDGPHRKIVLVVVLLAMTVGCILAAISAPFVVLLLGRALQGAGLSVLPLTMSIARDHVRPDRLPQLLVSLSVTATVGLGLGYPLSGLIADHWSFHGCFWFGAGFAALAVVCTMAVVASSVNRVREKFDWGGSATLLTGIAALTLGLSQGESWGWASPFVLILLLSSPVILAGCVWYELRCANPIIDLLNLRHRAVLTADVAGFLLGIGMYMQVAMVPRFIQTPHSIGYGLDASVLDSGLILLPMSVAAFLAGRLTGRVSRIVGGVRVLPFGALLLAFSLTIFATARGHWWTILLIMTATGFGTGFSFAVMPRMIVHAVPSEETSRALAMNQLLRAIGFSIGSALSATILTAHTIAPARLPTDRGYTVGALVALVLVLGTAALTLYLRGTPAATMSDQGLPLGLEDAIAVGLMTEEA